MSDFGNPLSSPEPVSSHPTAETVSKDGVTQAGAVQSNAGEKATSSTKIRTLADLKSKAPEIWQKMLESLGMKICNEMRQHQERLKKLMREGNME
jgi:hypothetical protein